MRTPWRAPLLIQCFLSLLCENTAKTVDIIVKVQVLFSNQVQTDRDIVLSNND